MGVTGWKLYAICISWAFEHQSLWIVRTIKLWLQRLYCWNRRSSESCRILETFSLSLQFARRNILVWTRGKYIGFKCYIVFKTLILIIIMVSNTCSFQIFILLTIDENQLFNSLSSTFEEYETASHPLFSVVSSPRLFMNNIWELPERDVNNNVSRPREILKGPESDVLGRGPFYKS